MSSHRIMRSVLECSFRGTHTTVAILHQSQPERHVAITVHTCRHSNQGVASLGGYLIGLANIWRDEKAIELCSIRAHAESGVDTSVPTLMSTEVKSLPVCFIHCTVRLEAGEEAILTGVEGWDTKRPRSTPFATIITVIVGYDVFYALHKSTLMRDEQCVAVSKILCIAAFGCAANLGSRHVVPWIRAIHGVQHIGTTPALLVRPRVGLIPTTAFRSAGLITLPSVSVPIAKVKTFAATPTAEPELDPPGLTVRL
ncbi:hypothetical protein KC356_g51 [Hortaea werneckii]|nr:hypothetical protein KC356_g51 [Hortaea werneckii]